MPEAGATPARLKTEDRRLKTTPAAVVMSGVLWLLPAALAAAGPTPEARRAAVEDLIWAVLSSREFLFAR